MGREVKRVALDFDWPLDTVWEGFLNPHYEGHCDECPSCEGTGYSPLAQVLYNLWYGHLVHTTQPILRGIPASPQKEAVRQIVQRVRREMLAEYQSGQRYAHGWNARLEQADVDALWAEGRLYEFSPTRMGYVAFLEYVKTHPAPTFDLVNAWATQGLGHGSLNCHLVIEARCIALGIDSACHRCLGEGSVWDSQESKETAEAWEEQEPPAGSGYQLWETVTEGSPISPVFASEEAFVFWLVTEGGYSPAAARAFAEKGWAPSALVSVSADGVEVKMNIDVYEEGDDERHED